MQKYTLASIAHYTTDRDGNQLRTRDGRPYTRCLIKVKEYGQNSISGFGNKYTQTWKEGDTIECDITEKKSPDGQRTYYNFELPKRETGGIDQSTKDQLSRIEMGMQKLLAQNQEIYTILTMKPSEIEKEDMPFPDFGEEVPN